MDEKVKSKIEKVEEMLEEKSFFVEILRGYKKQVSAMFIIIGILICALTGSIFGVTIYFSSKIDKQQEKYLAIIDKQQTDFIDFLNQYDFVSYDQAGDGNIVNNGVGGDVFNGAKNSNSTEEEQNN